MAKGNFKKKFMSNMLIFNVLSFEKVSRKACLVYFVVVGVFWQVLSLNIYPSPPAD